MNELPLALALSAGMLAAVNPCGFALLPAYLSLLVVGDDQPRRLVAGRPLSGLGSAMRRGPAVTRSLPSMALFGAAYAAASLTCTIGPFLAIVVSSFRAESTVDGVVLFGAYAAGMGLIVGAASVAVALAQNGLVGRLRQVGSGAARAGGAVLLIAGAYVAYYGVYDVRTLRGGPVDDPVSDRAGELQRWLAGRVDAIGPGGFAITLAVLLTAVLAGWALQHRRLRQTEAAATPTAAAEATAVTRS